MLKYINPFIVIIDMDKANYNKKYYLKNKERIKRQVKEYNLQNKEKRGEYAKKYRQIPENKERMRIYNITYQKQYNSNII